LYEHFIVFYGLNKTKLASRMLASKFEPIPDGFSISQN